MGFMSLSDKDQLLDAPHGVYCFTWVWFDMVCQDYTQITEKTGTNILQKWGTDL